MKRKDFGGFDDCFLSPATKSRRLDGELLPLMQEDPIALVPDGLASNVCLTSNSFVQTKAPRVDDGTRVVNDSEEKAMVLSYQQNPKFLLSRTVPVPELPILLNSDMLPGLEDHLFWPGNSKPLELIENENKTLAVVPWVPHEPPMTSSEDGQVTVLLEPMEDGEATVFWGPMEAEVPEMMDTDHSDITYSQTVDSAEVIQRWQQQQQQQHSMAPEFLRSRYNSVAW